jgi:hypothetical protein
MGTIGTIARLPAIIDIGVPSNSTLLRGMAVTIDSTTKLARVLGASTERLAGYATSDADTDILQVPVACGKGGFTVWIKPSTGYTPVAGDVIYVNTTALDGTFYATAGTNTGATPLGFIVDAKADAYGCVEMAFWSA